MTTGWSTPRAAPRRALILAAALALAAAPLGLVAPGAEASFHEQPPPPTNQNNDCGSGRDATVQNPVALSNGAWCRAALAASADDTEDRFRTVWVSEGARIEFRASGINNFWPSTCLLRPNGYAENCLDEVVVEDVPGYYEGYWFVSASTSWGSGEYQVYVRVTNPPPNTAPTMYGLSCSPSPASLASAVPCSFYAGDDSSGIYYEVEFGDGTGTSRVPSSGTAKPLVLQQVTHTWPAVGTYTVKARAIDTKGLVSAWRTWTQTIQPNAAPSVAAFSCSQQDSAPGETVTCSIAASDDSTGLFLTLDWGDGAPPIRLPASGYAAPGAVLTAKHSFASTGPYTLSAVATDNDPSPLASAARTYTQYVLSRQTVVGTIDAGHPGTLVGESLNDYSPLNDGPTDGFDTVVIQLASPPTFGHSKAKVTYTAFGPADVDIRFLEEDGDLIRNSACARVSPGGAEQCLVPVNARFAAVSASAGALIRFTFTYTYA